MNTRFLTPSLLALGVSLGSVAHAELALEEIVVTAQKRVESAQDVPIAISAFSSKILQERNINSVQGLSNYTPNVTLDAGSPFSSSPAVLTAYIRGIGQDDFAFNLDPGVGVYLDGVYLARTVGANSDLLDVERIEVLKGPQGTLFGRNSVGGAISIVTRAPAEEFGFKGEVVIGEHGQMEVRGSADLPIIEDKLLSTFTFSSTERDGYVDRVPYTNQGYYISDPVTAYPRSNYGNTGNDTEGGENAFTMRGKFLLHATDSLDFTLSVDYQEIDQEGAANTLLDAYPLEGVPGELFGTAYNLCVNTPASLLPADVGGNFQALCGPRGTIGTSLAGVNVDDDPSNDRLTLSRDFISGDIDKSYATGPSFSYVENKGISLITDFAINENMSLKSITAYRDLEWSSAMDADGTPITIVEPGFNMNQEQLSQELQLTGTAFDARLDYVFGVYYFEEEGDLHDFVPFAEGLLQVDGLNTFDTTSWAVFTHLNYKVTDNLSLTLGARYTEEEKEFEGAQTDPNGFLYKLVFGVQLDEINDQFRQMLGFPDPSDPLRFYPPGTQKKSFDNFSPRIGFEYTIGDDAMVYGSYSMGYKTGGWTTRLSAPLAEAPDFEEEEAETYELGFKSELFDNRVRLNGAVFFTEYDGIQMTQTEGISPTTVNAGVAEIKGAELELQWAVAEGFTLTSSLGYIDDEYTELLAGVMAGDRLPKTPELKFNIAPRYEMSLNSGAALIFNGDYTWTDELYNNTENTELLKRDSYEMLNASVTFEEPEGKWAVTFGGNNLLDERYLTTGQFQVGGAITYGTYNRPKEYYMKLSFEF